MTSVTVRSATLIFGFILGLASLEAEQRAKSGVPHGGKATLHVSTTIQENPKTQWSADPDRGWVPAEEHRTLKEEKSKVLPPKNEQKRGEEAIDY